MRMDDEIMFRSSALYGSSHTEKSAAALNNEMKNLSVERLRALGYEDQIKQTKKVDIREFNKKTDGTGF